MIKNVFLIIISLLVLANHLMAFHNGFPVGTRSAALMNAYIALSDDSEAMLINPAGLGAIKDIHLYVSSYQWHEMFVFHTLLSVICPLPKNWGSMGVLWRGLNNSREIGFEDREDWMAVAYGNHIKDFYFGLNFKYQWLYSDSDIVLLKEKKGSMDIGILYFIKKNIKIGLVCQNTVFDKFSGMEVEAIERSYKIGFSFGLHKNLVFISEGEITDEELFGRVGAEWSIGDYLKLRGGVNEEMQFSFGACIILKTLEFGYAYQSSVNDLLSTHFVSLSYRIEVPFSL